MKNFKEVYKFPFSDHHDGWIYDDAENFIFQFEIDDEKMCELLLQVINGKVNLKNKELLFRHEEGYIISNTEQKVILIRGWGNLTSPNCLNFEYEDAMFIQDTLADYIVERLNFRK